MHLFKTLSLAVVLTATAVAENEALPDEDARIDEIIVRSTRIQATHYAGTSVAVITAKDIEINGSGFAVDALPFAAGVVAKRTGHFGGVTSVGIRGGPSDQTLVLIDGVKVNSGAGGYDFARLDANNIDSIEILKGPQSSLWGANATGGVIQVLTKRPTPGLSGGASAEYGSFDTRTIGGNISGANDWASFRIGVSDIATEGISKADEDNGNTEKDPYDSTTWSLRGSVNLINGADLSVVALQNRAKAGYDDYAFGAQGSIADGASLLKNDDWSGHTRLRFALLNGQFNNQVLIGRSKIRQENSGSFSSVSKRQRTIYRYQGNLTIAHQHELAFGVEQEKEREKATGASSRADSLFVLYSHHFSDGMIVSGGLRSDDVDYYGVKKTARVSVDYALAQRLRLHVAWGQGFQPPTLFQRTAFYPPAQAANTGLKPAQSESFDLGVTWDMSDAGHISVGVFRNETENLIIYSAGRYENIPSIRSKGIELNAEIPIGKRLSFQTSYAFIDAKGQDGHQAARRPRHSGQLVLSWMPTEAGRISALLYYNGKELESPLAGGGSVPDWTRVDLTGSYQVQRYLSVFARIENLFDADYQQVIGYGTPDRSASAGIKLLF